jgi:hypothetical protein
MPRSARDHDLVSGDNSLAEPVVHLEPQRVRVDERRFRQGHIDSVALQLVASDDGKGRQISWAYFASPPAYPAISARNGSR